MSDGRKGELHFAAGDWTPQSGCGVYASVECHDSGGGLFVEGPGGSLRLIGVIFTSGAVFLAARHQEVSAPNGTTFFCHPCRGRACGDINGDSMQRVDCADQCCLAALGKWPVIPWCLGDMDGDGWAGTDMDVMMIQCPSPAPPFGARRCDRNQWCYGDANLDGSVNSVDLQLIRDVRAGGASPDFAVSCRMCGACPPPYEWCRGDVNFDGFIDAGDEDIVDGLDGIMNGAMSAPYQCYQGAPGCEPPGPCPTPCPPP